MNRIPLLVAVAALAAVTGCDAMRSQDAGTATVGGDVVATVNGQPITQAQLDLYAQRRGGQVPRADLINDLVSIELLKQAAERDGLHETPQIAGELATQRNALLAQAAVRDRLEGNEITDEQVATEYQRYLDEELGEELNARHILVPERETAVGLIEQLDGGADFAELAAEHSEDTSAAEGGDLGWFEPGMMVPPFSQAAQALAEGEYTKEPVQTQFGWHVIKLEGRRTADAPPLEQVQNEIRGYLQSQSIEAWVNEMRGAADVQIAEEPAPEQAPEAAAEPAEPEEPSDG